MIAEGTVITAVGIGAGLACGLALQRLAGSYLGNVRMPGAWVVVGAAGILLAAAVVAIFSVVEAAPLRPLLFREPGDLATLLGTPAGIRALQRATLKAGWAGGR